MTLKIPDHITYKITDPKQKKKLSFIINKLGDGWKKDDIYQLISTRGINSTFELLNNDD